MRRPNAIRVGDKVRVVVPREVVRGALPAGNDAWWCRERDTGKEVVISGDRLRDMPLAEDFEVVG